MANSQGAANIGEVKSGTVLIVDDEAELVEILSEALSPICSKILTAKDGLEALEKIKSGEVDAVITDLNMPRMSGLEMLAELRSQMYQTPVVVLTAYGDKQNMLEAIRLDATDFIYKPFSEQTIIDTMKKALAMGVALKQMEAELNASFQNAGLAPDEIARHKKLQRVVRGMRIQQSVYVKKT